MKTLSFDTPVEIEQFYVTLIRKASVFRRLQIVNSLVKTTWRLSWQGICDRYPEESIDMRIKLFISLLYNDESLAKHIQNLIKKKNYIK